MDQQVNVPPTRLLQTIGALKIENELLREQLAIRDSIIQGLNDALLAKTSEPTDGTPSDTIAAPLIEN